MSTTKMAPAEMVDSQPAGIKEPDAIPLPRKIYGPVVYCPDYTTTHIFNRNFAVPLVKLTSQGEQTRPSVRQCRTTYTKNETTVTENPLLNTPVETEILRQKQDRHGGPIIMQQKHQMPQKQITGHWNEHTKAALAKK